MSLSAQTVQTVQSRAARQRELVARTIQGDRFAATDLFREFRVMAYGAGKKAAERYKLRGGEAAIDELAAAGLSQLMMSLGTYRPELAGVSTWAFWVLSRTADREAVRQCRQLCRNVPLPADIAADVTTARAEDAPDDWYKDACQMLTDKERDVITSRFGLCGHEAQTLEQIGRRRGCTRQNIQATARRAIRKMGEALKIREGYGHAN